MGSITSPRKSLRPNISECHTVTHSVRLSTSSNGIWNCNDGKVALVLIKNFAVKIDYLKHFVEDWVKCMFLDFGFTFATLAFVW